MTLGRKIIVLCVGVVLALAVSADDVADAGSVDVDAVFARLASLQGDWIGRSTKGWESLVSFEAIAAGSAVVETSHFEAHPGQKMMTVYHPDRDRLILTHYCVSKTQPRLQAVSWNDAQEEVTFVFFDSTSLESRDQGHMDSVVIRFIDENHFSSRWTWYQNGTEKWLEDITYERKK